MLQTLPGRDGEVRAKVLATLFQNRLDGQSINNVIKSLFVIPKRSTTSREGLRGLRPMYPNALDDIYTAVRAAEVTRNATAG